jgi:MoaA/NifB/PqqE/SkfB family radical SAM enzyme
MGQRLSHQLQKLAFFRLLLLKGRISRRKLVNMAANRVAWYRRSAVAAASPTVALLDASSHCTMHCVTCRHAPDDLIDITGQSEQSPGLGSMDFDRYCDIIDDLQHELLLATLYATGEPLLNRHIVDMVRYASDRGVATMLSSNGMLLDAVLAENLLNAGLDYMKVAVSGYTQSVYGVYHRGGDVDRVLANIAAFELARRRLGLRCLVVVDYVLFEHNRHEEAAVRRFCREHGIRFSLRYGRVFPGTGVESPAESRGHYRPRATACDWLWNIMTVCADGRSVPCCQFATAAEPFVAGEAGESVSAVWNGEVYQELRRVHGAAGRSASLPLCRACFYADIDFQS